MSSSEGHVDPRVERSRRVVREAALAELAASGYGAFTIDAVSVRCGVARSTIYRHWPDKLALVADALETLNRQPPPAPAGGDADPSPRHRIHQLLVHLAEAFRDSVLSACIPALIEGAEREAEVRRFLHGYSARRRRALVDAVAAAVAAGEVAGDVDPELAAQALSGPIVYRRVMTGRPFQPEEVGRLVDLVLGPSPSAHQPRSPGDRGLS